MSTTARTDKAATGRAGALYDECVSLESELSETRAALEQCVETLIQVKYHHEDDPTKHPGLAVEEICYSDLRACDSALTTAAALLNKFPKEGA